MAALDGRHALISRGVSGFGAAAAQAITGQAISVSGGEA
jgi:hypothetical protein